LTIFLQAYSLHRVNVHGFIRLIDLPSIHLYWPLLPLLLIRPRFCCSAAGHCRPARQAMYTRGQRLLQLLALILGIGIFFNILATIS
jgi:hypothetical protein